MMDKIAVFGASVGGIKVAQTLKNLGIFIEYFVDNDEKKWGNKIENIEVKNPQNLVDDKCKIIIASDYQNEIEIQLKQMGIFDRMVLKEKYILDYLFNVKDFFDQNQNKDIDSNRKKSIVIEFADKGLLYGGIETWALMVCRDLMKKGKEVRFFAKDTEQYIPKDIEDITEIIDYGYERYKESVYETAERLIQLLPCTIITSWHSQAMIAAILVKKMYPNQMSILSVIHTDKVALYRRQAYLEPYTDSILCVSKKIKRILEQEYNVPREKLIYKESPIHYEEYKKTYEVDRKNPIRVGFAARISKYHKRADLLLQLIKLMNERQINYSLEVAGDGPYLEKLQEGTKEFENIHLLGQISSEEIKEFWKKKDIFLSTSDFEGTSLSMLEAMGIGVVPVVTMVSGVDDFVVNGKNGFYCETGDIVSLADYIERLEKDRKKLEEFGEICQYQIKTRCKETDYIDIIEKYC